MLTKEKVAVIFAALTLLFPIVAHSFSGSISLTDTNWTVYNRFTTNGNQPTRTSDPAIQTPTLLQFPFPDASPTASNPTYTGFLLDKISLSLANNQRISATFSVPASPGTMFIGNPNGAACGPASTVRLFFQTSGSGNPGDVTGGNPGGAFETHYWWANPTDGSIGSYTFTPSGMSVPITLSVPLTGSDWSDFYGHFGTVGGTFPPSATGPDYSANFNAAIGDIKYIGLSFGSGCFFANGVGVNSNTGNANFDLMSYSISP